MKFSLCVLLFIGILSVQAIRLKQQNKDKSYVSGSFTIYDDVNELEEDKTYYIVSVHYGRNFGKDCKGWVYMQDSGSFTITFEDNNTYRLKHSSGQYLAIDSSGRHLTSSLTSSSKLYLSNNGNGICIHRGGKNLRMYYQYVFPFGEYLTNTAASCNAWEKWKFWYRN